MGILNKAELEKQKKREGLREFVRELLAYKLFHPQSYTISLRIRKGDDSYFLEVDVTKRIIHLLEYCDRRISETSFQGLQQAGAELGYKVDRKLIG